MSLDGMSEADFVEVVSELPLLCVPNPERFSSTSMSSWLEKNDARADISGPVLSAPWAPGSPPRPL
jgi:hypothetical protein